MAQHQWFQSLEIHVFGCLHVETCLKTQEIHSMSLLKKKHYGTSWTMPHAIDMEWMTFLGQPSWGMLSMSQPRSWAARLVLGQELIDPVEGPFVWQTHRQKDLAQRAQRGLRSASNDSNCKPPCINPLSPPQRWGSPKMGIRVRVPNLTASFWSLKQLSGDCKFQANRKLMLSLAWTTCIMTFRVQLHHCHAQFVGCENPRVVAMALTGR